MTLISLLITYVVVPIYGNVIWDALKGAWKRLTKKTPEDLYLKALSTSLEHVRPQLRELSTDGNVKIDEGAFQRALHHAPSSNPKSSSLRRMQAETVIGELALAMRKENVLVIGGHMLDDSEYESMAKQLITAANSEFKNAISANPDQLLMAILSEVQANGQDIESVGPQLESLFGVTHQQLKEMRTTLETKIDSLQVGVNALVENQSFEADIEKLKKRTQETLIQTRHLAHLQSRIGEIKIERTVTAELLQKANAGSLLVVGVPGAGKSGVLHEFVQTLLDSDRNVIFLTVDSLEGLGHSIRDKIGLSNSLTDVLSNWSGDRQAYAVFDGLDAARSSTSSKAVRDLITLIKEQAPQWNVIASVRTFDLWNSHELRRLFAGSLNTSYYDPDLENIAHLMVPLLSDEELAYVVDKFPDLGALMKYAPTSLKELVRVPFNLDLVVQLISGDMPQADFQPVSTQIELLEAFWLRRVMTDNGHGDEREALLRGIVRRMVDGSSLQVSRNEILDLPHVNQLRALQSEGVLAEPLAEGSHYVGTGTVAFNHHILYDFAVSRYLFRIGAEPLSSLLSQHRTWTLTLRASLVLHFQYLWQLDHGHNRFWSDAVNLNSYDDVPVIGKLVSATVAADSASSFDDLENFANLLDESLTANSSRQLLAQITTAFRCRMESPNANAEIPLAWYELLEQMSTHLSVDSVGITYNLLKLLVEGAADSDQRLKYCNQTACELLSFLWEQPVRYSWLVQRSIEIIGQTFEANPVGSARVVRQMIQPEHLAEHGHEEIARIAKYIPIIAAHEPQLMLDLYLSAFQYEETSDESTNWGRSQILGMTSNRRQDYDGGLYSLTEAFEPLLRVAPDFALRLLDPVVTAERTNYLPQTPPTHEFSFLGETVTIRVDYSSMWDYGEFRHDNDQRMLDTLSKHIGEVAQNADTEAIASLLKSIARHCTSAVIWKYVLVACTEHPDTLGARAYDLAVARPLALLDDTKGAYAKFVSAIFPLVSKEERAIVEELILSFPSIVTDKKDGEQLRNFILRHLPADMFVSEDAKAIVETTNSIIPEQEEPSWLFEESSIEREPPLTLLGLAMEKIAKFNKRFEGSAPSISECELIVDEMRIAIGLLEEPATQEGKANDDHIQLLLEACERIARTRDLSCHLELGILVRSFLLQYVTNPRPEFSEESARAFDPMPHWGIPAPRVEAASGLIKLARLEECLTTEVKDAIVDLACDPVPAVRFQIAKNCDALTFTDPELLKILVDNFAKDEKSLGVLLGFVSNALGKLLEVDTSLVVASIKAILERVPSAEDAEKVRRHCAYHLADAYIWRDDPLSEELLQRMIGSPTENSVEIMAILGRLRRPMSVVNILPQDPARARARANTLNLLELIVQSLLSELRNFNDESKHSDSRPSDKGTVDDARHLARMIDTLSTELYFASGTYAARQSDAKEISTTVLQMRAFFDDIEICLKYIAEISGLNILGHGLGSTTYRIVEILVHYIDVDPERMLLWLGRFVREGRKTGFQYETLPRSHLTSGVSRYLTDYQYLLDDEEHKLSLIEVLDSLVEGGACEGVRLLYQLDEMGR